MPTKNDVIDHYHQNMFDFDRPNPSWTASCAAYLDALFPGGLKGKRVVDYGFGRGNWSLAFLEQGAAHVTAIDASCKAVDRFSQFAEDEAINNLSVQLGNADEELLDVQADVIFLYGILHHVKYPSRLLKSASQMCATPDSRVVIYAYNANSLRQTIAEIGRSAINRTPKALREFMLTLHPDARIRAMDDLTAPCINFWTNLELTEMLQKAGLSTISQLADFAAFEGNSHTPEFEPYVFIASPSDDATVATTHQISPNTPDLEHLESLASAVLGELNESERVQFAVGLFNTSFAAKGAERYFERVFSLWRYIVFVGLSKGARFADTLPVETRSLFNATHDRKAFSDAISGAARYSDPEVSIASFIKRGGFRL